jgi:hypothetical protein
VKGISKAKAAGFIEQAQALIGSDKSSPNRP